MNTGLNWRAWRHGFSNRSADIRSIFSRTRARLDFVCTISGHTIYVSRQADVARMDLFVGPKS